MYGHHGLVGHPPRLRHGLAPPSGQTQDIRVLAFDADPGERWLVGHRITIAGLVAHAATPGRSGRVGQDSFMDLKRIVFRPDGNSG